MDILNEQWSLIEKFFVEKRQNKVGRPPRPAREVLGGILWILRTGAQWAELPDRYPPYQTCHRWFQKWNDNMVMEKVLTALAEDLRDRGQIDIRECFIDGTFAPSKKGAQALAKLSGGRGPRSWQSQTFMVYLSPYALIALKHMK